MAIAANFPSIKPSLNLDFANVGRLDPRVTFTRASTATYFDQLGVLQSAANDAPRFDYNPSTLAPLGLLIEEQRTNSIRNNTMQGAVAGSPGTLPTNWSTGLAGLTQEIVGTGTQNGINYIDIRLSGTSTGTQAVIRWEGSSNIAVLDGQSWTHSVWLSLRSGALPSGAVNISSNLFTSGGAYIADFGSLNVKPSISASLTRVTSAATINSATAAFARPYIFFLMASGETVDFTIRIGLPQLEQGAFATSVIPTTTTALTRNADVASMTGTNFSSWYNASQGTILANTTVLAVAPSTALQGVFAINDGTADNRMTVYKRANADVSTRFDVTAATINSCFLNAGTFTTTNRIAAAYATDNFAAVLNGGSPATDTGGAVPTVTQINIGSYVGATSFLNGHIQRIAYYPTRLTNAQLQALTG